MRTAHQHVIVQIVVCGVIVRMVPVYLVGDVQTQKLAARLPFARTQKSARLGAQWT